MSNPPSHVLFSYEISGDGNGIALEDKDVSAKIKSKTLTWVHLNGNSENARKWLKKEVDYLDNIIIDALLAEETRPRMLEFGNGALMILRGVNLNENASPEDMISIRVWVDPARIITIQRRNLKAIRDIKEKFEAGTGPKNAGDFITALTDRLFSRMEPVLCEMDEKLDTYEEKIINRPDITERKKITTLSKQSILLRRYIAPQKDVMLHLRSAELGWLDQTHKRKLQESLDRITRYIEDLDAIRERAQIVKDELANLLADKMNRNMYVISILSAIFLPLGFLTGLLGINVGGMPGAEYDMAFWLVCLICIALIASIVSIFRYLKWF